MTHQSLHNRSSVRRAPNFKSAMVFITFAGIKLISPRAAGVLQNCIALESHLQSCFAVQNNGPKPEPSPFPGGSVTWRSCGQASTYSSKGGRPCFSMNSPSSCVKKGRGVLHRKRTPHEPRSSLSRMGRLGRKISLFGSTLPRRSGGALFCLFLRLLCERYCRRHSSSSLSSSYSSILMRGCWTVLVSEQ